MQSASCEMPDWMNHKLESRFPGEISTTSDMQVIHFNMGFPDGSASKEYACSAGDTGSIPGSRRSPGGGNGNPPQYSSLGNPMDRGAWQAIVQRVAKNWTQLSD